MPSLGYRYFAAVVLLSASTTSGHVVANDHVVAASAETPPPIPSHCTIPRLAASPDLLSAFRATYKGRAPVIFPSPPSGAAAALAAPVLLHAYGHLPVTLASSNRNSYEKRASTLFRYVAEDFEPVTLASAADRTWYLFGDTLPTPEWAPLHATFSVPLDAARDEPVVAWGIGGRHSGVPFHRHGAVYAATVLGRKRWWLAPPHREPAFDGNATQLAYASAHAAADADGVVACTVEAGESIYVPPMWWHATLNLEAYNAFTTVFVREAVPETAWL